MTQKILLAVDMKIIMEEHMRRKGLYSFFAKFSLSDLIQTVLSIDPYVDYSQHIYDALEMRFEDDDVGIDIDLFVIFYESLMEDIDTAIVDQYKIAYEDIGRSSYLFHRWIDRTSLLIEVLK